MSLFADSNVRIDVLKKRAFNYRWAEVPEGMIPLTAADPDYPVAPEIQQALMEYVQDGYFSYTPKLGYPEFAMSISRALKERKGEEIDPNLILPIDSAARGMYVIAETVLKPGDEMIVFDPVDYLFRESCLAAGGKVVLFPAELKDGYIDLSALESTVSLPHLPSNTKTVSEVKGMPIQQAVIGSCTNGRISDMRIAAEILKGRKVADGVRCIVIPATQEVYLQCIKEGLTEIFIESGCAFSTPTCGPCLGGHMGVMCEGERAISTTNRNFVGRMGHVKSEVVLASPAIAAASAVKGCIADPADL